ncbi:sperm flagellar protein 1 [Tachyglossus aculeatus]|uniref:sperm flagellar protein 1 n=1 Tax=Tachyglossus aculeatus TaxID=9261 RepID=UPI0018F5E2EA|nr:sperm flagellar protein 1 [Tachyglossus aculeatus]
MSGGLGSRSDPLRELYAWVDQVPLSRPRRHLARDFSDGVLVAEIVKHFQPKLVEMHNYIPASSTDQKLSNWSTLNRKVFPKLNFRVSTEDIRKVVANTSGAIEPILFTLRQKIEEKWKEKANQEAQTNTKDLGCRQVTTTKHLGLISGWVPGTEPPTLCVTRQTSLPRCYVFHKLTPIGGKTQWSPQWNRERDTVVTPMGREGEYNRGSPKHSLPSDRKTFPDGKSPAWINDHSGRQNTSCNHCAHLENGIQQLLEEKEEALIALQETVQILQKKVDRLEHLVQLKDLRIENLTKHLNNPKEQRNTK